MLRQGRSIWVRVAVRTRADCSQPPAGIQALRYENKSRHSFSFVVWLFPFKKFDHCRNKAVTAFGSAVMGELTMWQQQTKFRDLKSIQKQFRTLFWHDEVIAVNSSHFSPLQLSLSQVQLNEQKILSKLLNYCQLPHRQAGNSLRLLDSLSIFGCIRRTRENLRNKIVPWARKHIRSTITKKNNREL